MSTFKRHNSTYLDQQHIREIAASQQVACRSILSETQESKLALYTCSTSTGTRFSGWTARTNGESLPESEALPSVVFFAECLLSGTRQRRLCRVPHSVKVGSRQRAPLPSAKHSAQVDTRQIHVCRVSCTRQTGLSAKGRQRPSQS
jgi:hypothetical protein